MTRTGTAFEQFLTRHDAEAWMVALESLRPSIHEVDRTATQIWFAFYPLNLHRALEQAADAEQLARRLLLQGRYELKDQIDTSHRFLYGHRYWPEVKKAVAAEAAGSATPQDLESAVRALASRVAAQLKVEESLLTGITAVALMTLQQVGLEAFEAAPGTVQISQKLARKSPEQILAERAKDDKQGLLGFLKTVDQTWTVTYDEGDPQAHFKLMNAEELASGAARDQSQNWRARDARCIEGPIPVECRAASCGTCWVGVLGGAEKLSDVGRLEGRALQTFGYSESSEPKPLIRLACMARASGAVSIVIPPWNGVFGKYLRQLQQGAEHAQETRPETEESLA